MSKRWMTGVVVVVLAACAPPANLNSTPAVTEVGTPQGQAQTATIGPGGGTLNSTDGLLSVVVPAGAVSADTTFSLQALSTTAPGAVRAFRLGPEGTTFAAPVKLSFHYSEEDLAGATFGALRVASQDSSRRWQVSPSTVAENEKTITVETTHFSDWTMLLGWRLVPGRARVKPGENLSLTARYCNLTEDDSGLQTLVATCQDIDEGLGRLLLLRNWSVNGTVGGSAAVGTVRPGDPTAVYTAPGAALSNPVSISVEITPPQVKRKELLVANVTVGDKLPSLIKGTFTYVEKRSGTTQTYEYSGKGVAEFHPWFEHAAATYRMSGPFSLESIKMSDGNCECTGTSEVRDLSQGPSASLALHPASSGEGGTYSFGFGMTLPVHLTCTKLTADAICGNRDFDLAIPWSLEPTGTFGTCTVTTTNSYSTITSFVGQTHSRCGTTDIKDTTVIWGFGGQE